LKVPVGHSLGQGLPTLPQSRAAERPTPGKRQLRACVGGYADGILDGLVTEVVLPFFPGDEVSHVVSASWPVAA
jgi:hypothetical protein